MRTDGMIYYMVNVCFTLIADEGKDKKIKEKYLCKAVSCTDAEAIVTANFTDSQDFKVESISETKIIDVLEGKVKAE